MDQTDSDRRLAFYETLNTVCWVALDISWFFQSKLPSVILAVPTILTCLVVVRYTEKKAVPLLVSGAVAFWATFNVFWVLGDLEILSWGLEAARIFILLLVVCLVGALSAAAYSNSAKAIVLERLRRLRIGETK